MSNQFLPNFNSRELLYMQIFIVFFYFCFCCWIIKYNRWFYRFLQNVSKNRCTWTEKYSQMVPRAPVSFRLKSRLVASVGWILWWNTVKSHFMTKVRLNCLFFWYNWHRQELETGRFLFFKFPPVSLRRVISRGRLDVLKGV